MNSGRREDTHPPRGARRWLPAAAILAVALLLALWSGTGRESSGAPTEPSAVVAAPRALPAADTPDAPSVAAITAGAAPPAPTSLASGHAFLRVMVEEAGLVVSTPFVRITQKADGSTDVRSLGTPLEAQWPSIPAGGYTLEALGDAWVVDEPEITLTGGEMRVVTVSPRRSAVVRVVGGFSGKPVATSSVDVQARPVGTEEEADVEMTSPSSATDGRFVLMGLPSVLPDGRAIEALQVTVRLERDRAWSSWITLASLDSTPAITIRTPETAVVGRVTRAAGDGLADAAPARVHVELRPLGDNGMYAHSSDSSWSGPGGALSILTTPDTAVGFADRNGGYALRLSALPTAPMHLVASNGLDLPADSGPLSFDPAHLPLHADLVLPAAGVLRVTVRMGVASTKDGKQAAPYTLHVASARGLGPDGTPTRNFHSTFQNPGAFVGGEGSSLEFLIGALDAGDYDLSVELQPANNVLSPPPARRLAQRVRVETGAPTLVQLDATTPSSASTVSGRVLLPPGLSGDSVEATLVGTGMSRSAELSAEGGFSFADVPPGSYSLHVSGAGSDFPHLLWRPGTRGSSVCGRLDVRVERGDVILPPLDLTRPELRVSAAADTRYVVVKGDDGTLAGIDLDEHGHGSVFGLAPGHYTAKCDVKDHAAASFEMAAGASVVTVEVP